MTQANNHFRKTAVTLAVKIQHIDRVATDLTAELQLAHQIIGAMTRQLTLQQKQQLSQILIANSITDDGLNRHLERQDLIAQAKHFAQQNWSVQ
jgi:serine phosphatase RsbU (regulator of sigma subunit)